MAESPRFDIPRGEIFAVHEAALRLENGHHPYELANASSIAANWEAEKQANPLLFDGEVVLSSELTYSERRLEGAFRVVRYSTFLYWRHRRPVPDVEHLFAHAMPVTKDNALVAIRMGKHTASPGAVYFAGGTLEPQDFREGLADLDSNMTRELREETGIDLTGVPHDSALHAFSSTTGTALVRRFYLTVDAEEIAGAIRRFVASEAEPEIEGPVIIRYPDESPAGLAAHMPPFINWHFTERK